MEDTSWMFEIEADGAKAWAEGMAAGLVAGARREDDARDALEQALLDVKAKRKKLHQITRQRAASEKSAQKMARQLFGDVLVDSAIAKLSGKV